MWVVIPRIEDSRNLFAVGQLIVFDAEELMVVSVWDAGEIHHPKRDC